MKNADFPLRKFRVCLLLTVDPPGNPLLEDDEFRTKIFGVTLWLCQNNELENP